MTWTQNDTSPAATFTCSSTDPVTLVVTPANLTGATTVMHMRRPDRTTVSRTVGGSGLTIISAIAGTISYKPQVGDLTTAGTYEFELQVTFANDDLQTFAEVRQYVRGEFA